MQLEEDSKMSEKKYHHHSHEHARGSGEVTTLPNEKLDELIEIGRHAKHEHAEKLDELRHEVHAEAKTKDELLSRRDEKEPEVSTGLINHELKDMAYKRTLTRVQKDLSMPERAFSKLVHSPALEAASDLGAKTVARSSGLLAGGVFAFLGSSSFLWISKHYGYEYNFLIFLFFFVGGFFIGLLLELIFRTFQSEKS